MPTLKDAAEYGANLIARRLGYEVRPWRVDHLAEGFIGYYAEAQRLGLDVNDYQEQRLGWVPAGPTLKRVLFPHLTPTSVVVEVGPGTGRQARHILTQVPNGELHLVDHSPWVVRFLQAYFQASPRVRAHLNDGYRLPFEDEGWADVIFCGGTIIALKLGVVDLYAREFFRVLKPGGSAVFDYIDPGTPEGWDHLRQQTPYLRTIYTYHAASAVERVFQEAGFAVGERHQDGKSTYLRVCKGGV
jgi:ubiquinone/menaquinone biosynthesis C-methylase UbiE